MKTVTTMGKLIYRRREVADILGFSQAQILKFERAGLLHPIRIKGADGVELRSVRYAASEVESLGQRWIEQAATAEPHT
jgi:predicted DNA-binding transcriptional regulator AlpA